MFKVVTTVVVLPSAYVSGSFVVYAASSSVGVSGSRKPRPNLSTTMVFVVSSSMARPFPLESSHAFYN
ncbi:hypothetical protein GOP47_0019029 [Adiantum capillus-veneris]|uniref:Uncharacterized protein n=1 Tax=Adiantum capillus-veneris TaxID=13818 RepID=A0A9D4UEM6_ADICA|nr:hypothetical protein GOP47_0019029 [Adiantum capillus-veneris]